MALLDDVFKKKKKKEENNKKVNTSETSSPSIQNTNSKPKKTVDSLPIGVQGSNFLTNTQKSSSSNINTIPQTKNQNTWDNVVSFLKNVGRGTINSFGSAHKYAENITEIGNSNYKDSRERQFYTSPYVSMADKIRLRSAQNQYNSNIMSALQKNDGRTVEEKIKGAINKTKEENKDRVFDVPETNLTKKVASDIMEKQQNQMALETEKATGNISRFLIGDVAPSMGQNLTQSALSLINPALGIGFTTMSAGGSYFDEAKQRGMSDKKALLYSAIGAGVEGATEGISFENVSKAGKGIGNLIKTGSFKTLEDGGEAVVKNTLREALKNYGISVAEEGVQEFLTDPIMEAAADAIDGKGDWDNIWQRAFKSGLAGMISSAISGGATIGVQSCVSVVDKVATGQNVTQEELVKANNDAIKNGVQVGNTNVEQSNNLKTNLQSMINNLNISEESKQEIQSRISSDININDFEYKTITDSIKNEVRANAEQQATDLINNTAQQYDQLEQAKQDLDNIKAEDFKDAESRKFYAQQINKEFDSTIMDNILPMYPENRNGRRTVKQYKEIATQYGKAMAENGLSFDDVRANTVGAWQYYEPSKNITRYDNQQKQNQGFEKLNSQVWSQLVYDSYKNTMKTQIAEQQKNLQANMESQVQAFKDEYDTIIDTIDNLGTQETQVTRSPEEVERTKKLVEDFAKNRGVKVEYNADVFNNSNEEAFIKDNGKGDRTIYINPNADPDTILVKLATHEMFHDTIRTEPHDKLTRLVMDKLKADENYNTYRESVREAYQEQLEGKTQAEQDAIIDEEMTAKYLGEYLGDEQFVQQLVNSTNRTTVQRIMDWIDNRLQQIKNIVTGNTEAEYWRKVRENFEKAYNSKYQGQEGTQYSLSTSQKKYLEKTNNNEKLKEKEFYSLYSAHKIANTENALNIIKSIQENGYKPSALSFGNDLTNSYHSYIDGKPGINDRYAPKKGEYVLFVPENWVNDAVFGIKPGYKPRDFEIVRVERDYQPYYELYEKAYDKYMESIGEQSNATTDNQGRTLTKEQQEYFKDSENRNENGELKEMYRGSKETINVFDKNNKAKRYTNFGTEYETDVKGFYFTDNKEFAEQFGDVKPYYLNTEKILKLDNNIEDLNKIFKPMLDNMLKNQDISQTQYDAILENGTTYKRFIDEDGVDWQTIDDEAFNDSIKIMQELGYDSIAVNEGDNQKSLMVFNSNQIKNVDNLKPTDNPDIRYSKKTDFDEALKEDNQGRTLSKEQEEGNEQLGFNEQSWETVQDGDKSYQRKLVRTFKDNEGNIFKLYTLTNNHNELTINGKSYRGSRGAILNEIKNYWKGQGTFTEINTNNTDAKFSKKTAFDKALQEDSQGRTLTKEQQEYFKDSKVRDENGNLLTMYHGTPNGEHTVFNDGTYFTSRKEYAEGYQDPGASMLTQKQQKSNPKVYEVYLNMENPFTIQDEKAKKIYLDEYVKGGNSLYLDPYTDYTDYINNLDEIDWTEGEDLREWLKENHPEYDGLILDEGGDGGYGESEYKWRGKSYVIFNANQVKNVDNLNPTDNPDIRYSKKTKFDEALKENIETTNNGKNLLALHNLTEDKLRGVLELGGFPVPSIAVTNNPMSNANFGEISVVFNKDTINPELDPRNKVYGRDAYTSRIPDIASKINEKGLKEVSKATGIEEWRLRENFKETTLEKAVDELRTSEEILDKYLKEKGLEVKPVYRDFKGLSSLNQDSLQKFINEHPDLLNLNYTDQQTYSTYEKYYNDVHNLFVENLMNDPSGEITRETAENLYKDYPGYNHWNYFIKDLRTVNELNGEQQLDEYATKKAKEKAVDIDSKEYKDFVSNLISPMFEGKYVRNNKEYYTKTGTPRSFEQRYDDYTLENIVKIMNENKGTGQEGSPFGVGIGELAGDASKRFKSIEDIKNNEYLLDTKNKEEYKALLDKYGDEFRDLQSDITKKYGDTDVESIIWRDRGVADAMQNIARKIADGKKISVDSVIKQYNKNNIDVTEKQAQQTIDLLNDISSLPTDYFEAKPQRAVGFDEIDTVVLPSNTSEDIKQALTDRGIKYIEYDSNNENARSDILKSLDEYKFNKKAKAFDDYLKANNPNRSGVTIGDLQQKLPTKQATQLPTAKKTQTIQQNKAEKTTANLPIQEDTITVPFEANENRLPSQKQRKAYQSIIESPVMSEEAKKVARKYIGQDTYIPDSNKQQLARADATINKVGVEKALDTLETNAMEGKRITADDIAQGDRLIQYYSLIGDGENLQRAVRAVAMAGTQAGRSVQAFALLRHQTPQGMAIWIQNSVDKLNSRTKNGQFDFTPEMQQKILNSTEENLQQNVDEVMKELGQQVPVDAMGKIDAWRYFSMLANPKTHIRNIVGNFAMGLSQQVKSKIAGTIEQVARQDRTHTSLFEKRSKENIKFAKQDLKNVTSQLGMGENKYVNPKNQIQQNQRVFKSDALENTLGKMFKLNDNLLEAEDNFGLKNAYIRNLSDYMTANKLNPNTITNEQLQQARKVAIEESLRATFHQASDLASLINQFENKNLGTKLLVGGLVPFKKTPINVAKSGFGYSPVGLAKTIVYDTVQLRKGNINVNQYIDNLSQGLTGTGIALVGYALAEAGILKAGGDDDKEDKYKQAMGEQPYSIMINGKSYSLDWLAPSGIPLFVGAELSKLVHDTEETSEESENKIYEALGRVTEATTSLLNPMSEMSMISGLTSSLKSYSQGTGALMDIPTNMIKSYAGQFVPTALGQVARTLDTYERDTSSTAKGTLAKAIDSTKNQMMSKIPGLRQMLPTKKDIWGEEVETQDYFHNAVLPYTKKEIKTNPVDKELNDLYEKTGENIYPNTSLEKTVTYEGSKTRLTNQDYNDFKTNYGKTSYKLLDNLISSKEYSGMTDEQKVKAVKDVYTYANNLNKTEYAEKKGIDFKVPSDVKQVRSIKANGGTESDYFKYKGLTDGLSKESEKMTALKDSSLSAKSKRAVYISTVGSDDTFYQNTNIGINDYLGYKTADIQGVKDSSGKTISGSVKQAQLDYINKNISGYENRLLLMGKNYKLSRTQQQDLANYINTLDNAEDLYSELSKNFTVSNGTVYYK